MFRLRPLGDLAVPPTPTIDTGPPDQVTAVPLEAHRTDGFDISPNLELARGARREQPLMLRYADDLRRQGHDVVRHSYRPDPNGRSLYCDGFDESAGAIIESKSSASREAIRMAIGQLLDYSNLEAVRPRSLLLLVPNRPRHDIVELLRSLGITAVYPDGDRWVHVSP